jgi:transcriptional regulator with XRE-family HTH domain
VNSLMTESRGAFGARLKAAREATGVTIDQIAASTKISAALLEGLERGDVSRWPCGLFRRSYLRDYLRMTGLPPDPIVAEFVRLFPHPDDHSPVIERVPASTEHPPAPLSITFADDRAGHPSRLRARLAAASIDGAIVAALSTAATLTLSVEPGMGLAGVAVAYHAGATIALGSTIGARWMAERRVIRWKRSGVRAAPAEDPSPKALPSASTA